MLPDVRFRSAAAGLAEPSLRAECTYTYAEAIGPEASPVERVLVTLPEGWMLPELLRRDGGRAAASKVPAVKGSGVMAPAST